MKTTKLFLTKMTAVVMGFALILTSCSKDKEGPTEPTVDEVKFESASLGTFIKQQLNLATSATIKPEDLKGLTELNIRGALTDVTSLKGLEYATELTLLDFGGNQVTDLAPIKDLKKITYLRMNETPVTDLSPLSNFTTLTYFNANQAGGITSIAALDKNADMQQVILRGNNLGNGVFTTLAKFTKLHRANLRATGVTDITVLGELMSKGALLKSTAGYTDGDSEVDLRENIIDTYAPIQSFIDNGTAVPVSKGETNPNTEEIVFEDAELAAFIKAELALAEGAKITRSALANLTQLNIRGMLTTVTSLKGLEAATELTLLDFGGNQVSDLTPIKDLKKITYLRMNETPVKDLSPLKEYTTLAYFNANQAGGITDLSPLAKNLGMQEMILRGNTLGDSTFETIKLFTKLHRLNLRSTGISTVAILGELMSKGALLKTTAGYIDGDSEIDLRGNTITDYSPIQSYIDAGTAVTVVK